MGGILELHAVGRTAIQTLAAKRRKRMGHEWMSGAA
jgi:hypothetical protein